jgi:hypothetical protein
MTFKKDYINYLLYTVVNSPQSGFRENYRLSKLVDSIISIDDVMKVTYLVGKTAGLDLLFKYLLYISDKIDKSQVTIFNLKDNFDYDRMNLEKICSKIENYKSENVQEAIKSITDEEAADKKNTKDPESIKIETADEIPDETRQGNIVDIESIPEDDTESFEEDTGLTLLENRESNLGEAEVFELEKISESVENSADSVEETSPSDEEIAEGSDNDLVSNDLISMKEDITGDESEITETEEGSFSSNEYEAGEKALTGEKTEEDTSFAEEDAELPADLPEIEIEVHKPKSSLSREEPHVKEEAITNEAYYTFETKFFEEVKILEKLLASVSKDCKADDAGKLSERCLQCTTEIIGITSELSNLSRQLSFDLIADIFLTMNIYFTKSISQPDLLTGERVKLLDSSLALVNSLIKGEDYLNYDTVVERMEKLKNDITAQPEKASPLEKIVRSEEEEQEKEEQRMASSESAEGIEAAGKNIQPAMTDEEDQPRQVRVERPQMKQSQLDSANFKLKYLIKEFEKSFNSIGSLKGEYSKFDALEKISELNNALRLIAKISSAIKQNDLLKLAEVTYVFLKYVKDYRMDMQEPEIQQIIKYIIFTFKMLLTDRKPEDFNVLVRHLNNPVKIFADS